MSKQTISQIIASIQSDQPNLNPTEIYNEGWMTRLLVHHSINEHLNLKNIVFGDLSNWTSEGLISSPFVFANKLREGYTHADMSLGDFKVDFNSRGQISIMEDASRFGIMEAKMGSPLSEGTTNAPNYNQVSRNIACIAYNTRDTNISTFFGVVAPEATLQKYDVKGKLKISFYHREIENRFDMYEFDDLIREDMEEVLRRVLAVQTFVLSYEEWIETFENPVVQKDLMDFYEQCLKWNNI